VRNSTISIPALIRGALQLDRHQAEPEAGNARLQQRRVHGTNGQLAVSQVETLCRNRGKKPVSFTASADLCRHLCAAKSDRRSLGPPMHTLTPLKPHYSSSHGDGLRKVPLILPMIRILVKAMHAYGLLWTSRTAEHHELRAKHTYWIPYPARV
jgi:hypothetical protein